MLCEHFILYQPYIERYLKAVIQRSTAPHVIVTVVTGICSVLAHRYP